MTKPIDDITAENSAMAAAPLLGQLRQLIVQARTQALRAVDSIQVRTCWEIGRHIQSALYAPVLFGFPNI